MKIKILSISILSILILISLGCQDNDPLKDINLKGEWIWIESVGGFWGVTNNPENTMQNRKLIIDDQFYKLYKNDSLLFESTYQIEISEKPLLKTDFRTLIILDSHYINQAFNIEENELELIDQCHDCFTRRYLRN